MLGRVLSRVSLLPLLPGAFDLPGRRGPEWISSFPVNRLAFHCHRAKHMALWPANPMGGCLTQAPQTGTAAPGLRDPGLAPEGRQLPLSGLFSNSPSGKQHPTNPRGRSSPPGVPARAPPCAALGWSAGFWQTAVSCTQWDLINVCCRRKGKNGSTPGQLDVGPQIGRASCRERVSSPV